MAAGDYRRQRHLGILPRTRGSQACVNKSAAGNRTGSCADVLPDLWQRFLLCPRVSRCRYPPTGHKETTANTVASIPDKITHNKITNQPSPPMSLLVTPTELSDLFDHLYPHAKRGQNYLFTQEHMGRFVSPPVLAGNFAKCPSQIPNA